MTKEQTPIQQKLKSIISVELMDLSIMDEVVEHKTNEIYKGVMVIINAQVLKALEREFSEVAVDWGQLSMMNGKEYYETEVKPKYKQINK